MGKASSSKKVARAAGTGGGRTNRGRRPWIYYLSLAVIVVLGTAMVYTSRSHRLHTISASGSTTPPRVGRDNWHVAYAIYECTAADKGRFLPPITDQHSNHGISTKGDGVIYVSPTSNSVAGKNATLDKFASAVGMTLNAGELKAPGAKDHRDGDDCGGKPGRVQVQVFSGPTDTTGVLSTLDPALVRFQDNILLTIAFMPKGAKIPPPPQNVIANLQKVVPATTTTTAPPASTPATSVPASTPATSAPATSAPATTTTTVKGTTSTTAKR
jgi:hypothetical protein